MSASIHVRIYQFPGIKRQISSFYLMCYHIYESTQLQKQIIYNYSITYVVVVLVYSVTAYK